MTTPTTASRLSSFLKWYFGYFFMLAGLYLLSVYLMPFVPVSIQLFFATKLMALFGGGMLSFTPVTSTVIGFACTALILLALPVIFKGLFILCHRPFNANNTLQEAVEINPATLHNPTNINTTIAKVSRSTTDALFQPVSVGSTTDPEIKIPQP